MKGQCVNGRIRAPIFRCRVRSCSFYAHVVLGGVVAELARATTIELYLAAGDTTWRERGVPRQPMAEAFGYPITVSSWERSVHAPTFLLYPLFRE